MRGSKATTIVLSLAALAAPAAAQAAHTGGVAPSVHTSYGPGESSSTGGSQYVPPSPVTAPASGTAQLVAGKAYPPVGAPTAVVGAIRAGNRLQNKAYLYGGGHKSFKSAAYDCSGTVSYALHGGGLLAAPLDSTSLMTWGAPGVGTWITVYANHGHTYVMIAGLRLDTSGTGGRGPRWLTAPRSTTGFVARHPAGL